MTDYEDLQKRCQRGATNLSEANNLLAECYGVLGKLAGENEAMRKDAERYQWFRDCGGEWNDVMVLDSHGRIICEELDERIDLAISKES